MSRRTIGARRGTYLLILICIGLGYALYVQYSTGLDAPGRSAVPTTQNLPALPAIRTFELAALRTLPETVSRPLFSANRRPDEKAAPAAKATPSVAFRLMGIVITPEGRIALVRPPRGAEVREMSEGQVIEGWKIATIMPDRLVLVSGDLKREVRIKDEVAPARRSRKRPVRKRIQRR